MREAQGDPFMKPKRLPYRRRTTFHDTAALVFLAVVLWLIHTLMKLYY